MLKVSRQILTEFLWLALSLVLTILVAFFFFGPSVLSTIVDVHFHDAYFVISRWHLLIPLFFLVTFIIYFSKKFSNSFSNTIQNWILVLAGLALVISLTFLVQTFSQLSTNSGCLYASPSAPGTGKKITGLTPYPLIKMVVNFLEVIQFITLIILLFAARSWGANNRKRV